MIEETLTRLERRHNMFADAVHEMKGETPQWAYATANARALACVHHTYRSGAQSLKKATMLELEKAFNKLEADGHIINTPVDRLQSELNEGFIQGLSRAWEVVATEPIPGPLIERAEHIGL